MSETSTENWRGTRAEHLQWCKDRALASVDAGELQHAFSSMASDLQKHPATVGHTRVELGAAQMMLGGLRTPAAMREHIEGYE